MGVLLLAIFLPLAAGALLPLLRRLPRRAQLAYVTAVLAAEAVLTVALACMDEVSVTLLRITPELVVAFRTDGVARVFSLIGALLWLPVGVYSFKYLTHEANENRFLSFYLLVLGALLGMDYASNLVSMYFFYELVTLTALPLVLHSGTKESIHAALKYLFYSIAGAFLALLGIFCVSRFTTLDFVPGGTLAGAVPESYLPLVRALVFCAVLGFGAKAGLYPLHGWLPAAHPVAPGPAVPAALAADLAPAVTVVILAPAVLGALPGAAALAAALPEAAALAAALPGAAALAAVLPEAAASAAALPEAAASAAAPGAAASAAAALGAAVLAAALPEAAASAAAPGAAALADAEPPPFPGILPARFSYDLGNKRIRSVMPHETHPR